MTEHLPGPADPHSARERIPPTHPRAKSALSAWQRTAYSVILGLTAIMLANTAYLVVSRLAGENAILGTGETAIPLFYQALLLSHTGLGLVFASGVGIFVLLHLAPVWKRRRVATLLSGLAALTAIGGLAYSGLFILTAAATRNHAWAWYLHISLAALFPLAFLLHRVWSYRSLSGDGFRKFAYVTGGLTALFLAGHAAAVRQDSPLQQESAQALIVDGSLAEYLRRSTTLNDGTSFVAASDVSIRSRFFPAGTSTTTGEFLDPRVLINEFADVEQLAASDFERFGFAVSDRIGAEMCVRCHMDIVEQWSQSAHRFASFNNPFYEATIDLMRETADTPVKPVLAHMQHFGIPRDQLPWVRSKWCSGCHDPALMIPGLMTQPIDRRTPAAQAGLTCLACHQIDALHNTTGNAHYNIADLQRDPYLFAGKNERWKAYLHDLAVKARPAVHMQQMLKPLHRTSEFCSACHKVNLDVPVNSYRWLRGQNEYDNWHDSGVAHNASRTFYKPPAPRDCRDCHMPLEDAPLGDVAAKNGKVRSHRFLAVNTALPYIRGDEDMLQRTEKFLRDGQLRVDLFAVGVVDAQGGVSHVYAPDATRPTLPAGRTIRADVVVRNLNVGHTFPGGTNDSNESWIEFQVLDDAGAVRFESGFVRPDRHVDPDAHFYRVVMLDHDGNRVFRRDAHNFHVPVYVNVIGPGTADVAHYEFIMPTELAGREITLRARLLWRKFDRAYTEFAFERNRAGFAAFSSVPDLPITEIAASEVRLAVSSAENDLQLNHDPPLTPDAWQRINDYGIALLLEGNTRDSIAAFRALTRHSPQRPDGFRNLARALRADGDLTTAYTALRDAERLAPGDLQNAWVWGQVLAEDGRLDEAIAAYRRITGEWRNDRGAWREIAVAAYRALRFEDSLEAAEQVLRIDPEDRIAHYYRMLTLRALERHADAEWAQAAYEKYSIDETAQEITRTHRLHSPADNLESQMVHIHTLSPRESRIVETEPSDTPDGTR